MSTLRGAVALASVVLCIGLLSACATPQPVGVGATSPVPLGDVQPGLPAGTVIGQGTVIDTGDEAELCLGGVMESLPPQCTGIPLVGWEWTDIDGSEASGDTRWGAYAVEGTYDGATFTVTSPPISLALYDPAVPLDPTDGEPGPADEATLTSTQDDIHAQLGDAALASWPQNGRLWVQVVWDDGSLQDAADARYGDDVVVIQSSLSETD